MVVLALLGIVIPMAYALLNSVMKVESATTNSYSAQGQAQLLLETLTKQLEAAAAPVSGGSPFVTASANSLTFYSDLGSTADPNASSGNAPTRITILTTPSSCSYCKKPSWTMTEQLTPPSSSGTYTASPSTVVVATGITPSTASPTSDCGGTPGIFQYWDDNATTSTCVPLDATNTPVSLSATNSSDVPALSEITDVVIDCSLQAANNGSSADPAPSTTVSSTIPLRNVEYGLANQ